jgi:phosphoadenylyl-sulfate reductase (thioredoxin)
MNDQQLLNESTELLGWAIERFGGRFAVVTALQREGVVVLDIARRIDPGIRAILLDTWRLPEETYTMVESVQRRLHVKVELANPDVAQVGTMLDRHGPNLFRRDLALRQLCCHVRKIEPMGRVLVGVDAWATGLRRDSARGRSAISAVQPDPVRPEKLKISPLAAWSRDAVERYGRDRGLPVHPLYERGYTSIGCAPCTRPVEVGEAERAGRWWWETEPGGECGLHGQSRAERFSAVLADWRDLLSRRPSRAGTPEGVH